jgi:hypothetical protein
MLLKTKDCCGKLRAKRECHRKQNWLHAEGGNVGENKGIVNGEL